MRHTRTTRPLITVLVALAAALATLVATAAPASAAPLAPVPKLDVDRYLGTWWQLATVPSFFGVRCAKDTNATYTRIDDRTIGVDNRCTSPTGQLDGIKGKAIVLDPVTNAQLAVKFPFVPNTLDSGDTPNYIVAWLQDGDSPTAPYRYAIVGDPTRFSGFLLSRDKTVSNAELRRLRGKVESVGYNSCTFLISPTTGGRSDYSPLCTV
ncbi:lipocalin family protein [Gordonia rhizosphera]|uniref:Lipocalin/cytosolic fatty-acid binding domain-containing protein n=1 Tax=Gordonia rhizosphera NBRC 16068 TaxID=1108045 RepID=K6W341_9ACTN|nr:lipocalin family protein [Gordonia rhizosphera]GAB93580.1 hypothetical protein GORHZ_229_00230 [Gordonia rhizosphera NBRC 16068]